MFGHWLTDRVTTQEGTLMHGAKRLTPPLCSPRAAAPVSMLENSLR